MERSVVLVAFDAQPSDRELAADLAEIADVQYKKDLTEADLSKISARAEVLVIGGGRGSVTADMIKAMPNLKFIQALAAGVNHVPFASMPESVLVSSGSGANSQEVAEHALALVMSAAKNVVRHTLAMRHGSCPHGEMSRTLRGRILGVLGVGSIGEKVAGMARCLDMKVWGCDVKGFREHTLDEFYTHGQLHDFLRGVDYLVICVPLTRETTGMIGGAELSVMKEGALLVNVSRGGVIEEKDMYEHLKKHPSFTACFDVWWKYSSDKTFKQDYPFEELDNVLMTPHNATHSPGQRVRMVQSAFDKVIKYLKGETVEGIADPQDYI